MTSFRGPSASARDEHFERREGLNPMADIGGWPRTGTVGGSRVARVLISADQARWVREQRNVLAELPAQTLITGTDVEMLAMPKLRVQTGLPFWTMAAASPGMPACSRSAPR